MKQFYSLTKTLLVVVSLLVGGASSVWGENMTTMTGRLGLADNSGNFGAYATKLVTIGTGESYEYTFINYNDGASEDQLYHNWYAEIRNTSNQHCGDVRADGHHWVWPDANNGATLTDNYTGDTYTAISSNVAVWAQAYNGVTVTVTVTRSNDGNTVTVTHSATTNVVGEVASRTYSGTYTCTGFGTDGVSVILSNEKSHQDITKVVYTNASGVSTMYKTVDLSQFDANSTYSDGTASFNLSNSQWSKLDLSNYYNDISGIITNVKLNFTENIGTGGRMCFGIFGNNKSTWGKGMPETANSVSTWGVCGDSNANRVYYSSKPSNVNTLTVGSSQAIEIDMDMINKSFSFVQGSTTLVNNQPFIDTYITSPKYFAGHTWTSESNTTTLSNMTIEIVYRDASYFVDECKTYETSAAFATYIDGLNSAGSLKNVEDVYAAYTSWQIAQAEENGLVDYTKVLYNADYSLGTKNGWTISGDANTGAALDDDKFGKIESNGNGGYQYYTGWNGRNVSQTISGLPAGVYRLTAKVYSWSGGAPVRLFANGVLSDQENGEDHTPSLDFSVTGEESSIKIGIGGVGGASENDNTDKTWGTWGYRIDYFTLTKIASSATIGTYGWATFSSAYALDFSEATEGLEAYMITGHEGNVVTKAQVTGTVPAGTGLLLKGDEGSYTIPVVGSSDTDVSSNRMVAGTGEAVDAGSGVTRYVLGVNETTNEAEFQKIVSTAATVAAGKAYLQFNEVISGARALRMSFGDETAVENVKAAAETAKKNGAYLENGKIAIYKNGMKFNVAGQQMK